MEQQKNMYEQNFPLHFCQNQTNFTFTTFRIYSEQYYYSYL
jgi:hypothetical protein